MVKTMKVVMSAAAALALLGVAGCATTAPYGVVAYGSAAPGYFWAAPRVLDYLEEVAGL